MAQGLSVAADRGYAAGAKPRVAQQGQRGLGKGVGQLHVDLADFVELFDFVDLFGLAGLAGVTRRPRVVIGPKRPDPVRRSWPAGTRPWPRPCLGS